jgi:hypothetical protein
METIKRLAEQLPNDADLGREIRVYLRRKAKDVDICVRCGKETTYPKTLPITNREYYVEGAGQLCEKCFLETYE